MNQRAVYLYLKTCRLQSSSGSCREAGWSSGPPGPRGHPGQRTAAQGAAGRWSAPGNAELQSHDGRSSQRSAAPTWWDDGCSPLDPGRKRWKRILVAANVDTETVVMLMHWSFHQDQKIWSTKRNVCLILLAQKGFWSSRTCRRVGCRIIWERWGSRSGRHKSHLWFPNTSGSRWWSLEVKGQNTTKREKTSCSGREFRELFLMLKTISMFTQNNVSAGADVLLPLLDDKVKLVS